MPFSTNILREIVYQRIFDTFLFYRQIVGIWEGWKQPSKFGIENMFFWEYPAPARWKEKTIFPNYILLNKKNPIRKRIWKKNLLISISYEEFESLFHFFFFFVLLIDFHRNLFPLFFYFSFNSLMRNSLAISAKHSVFEHTLCKRIFIK